MELKAVKGRNLQSERVEKMEGFKIYNLWNLWNLLGVFFRICQRESLNRGFFFSAYHAGRLVFVDLLLISFFQLWINGLVHHLYLKSGFGLEV